MIREPRPVDDAPITEDAEARRDAARNLLARRLGVDLSRPARCRPAWSELQVIVAGAVAYAGEGWDGTARCLRGNDRRRAGQLVRALNASGQDASVDQWFVLATAAVAELLHAVAESDDPKELIA